MLKKLKSKKILACVGLGLLGVGTIAGTTTYHYIQQHKISQSNTGFDADGKNYDYGDVIDLPSNITFKKNNNRASSLTVKATVLPDTATNKELEWSLVWADSGSHGNINDFVTITPSSDTHDCTINYKSAFNNQIKLIVKSKQNSSVFVECSLDCYYRFAYDPVYEFVVAGKNDNSFMLEFIGDQPYIVDEEYVNLGYLGIDLDSCNSDDIILLSSVGLTDSNYIGTTGSKDIRVDVKWSFDLAAVKAIQQYSDYDGDFDGTETIKLDSSTKSITLGDLIGQVTINEPGYGGLLYGILYGSLSCTYRICDDVQETSYSTTVKYRYAICDSLTQVGKITLNTGSYIF